MSQACSLKVLFCGYAPVHFMCFRPLYERLRAVEGVEIHLSGGYRSEVGGGYAYDHAMYERLPALPEHVRSVEEIQDRDYDVLFSAHTKAILPRRVEKRIQIFHGISFRNRAVRAENMGCDHYFLIGPYMSRRFREGSLLEHGDPRAVPVGFMKTDRLLNGTLDRRALLEHFGLDGARPILLFAPTGAKRNALETVGEEVIDRLASTVRYDILVKPHDHAKREIDWFERLARFQGPHCRIVRELDVIPLLFLSDLLITDASSVANEFALLDRPIVFIDTPQLIARALTVGGSMLDLDTWGRQGGAIVKEPARIAQVVEACLRNPGEHSPVRRKMVGDLFFNPGRATEAAMSWIRSHLLGRP